MILLMTLDPIMRYLLGRPFYWSNEVTTYLMVIMVFNGFCIALVKDKHVRVTLVFDRLPRRLQNMLWILTSVAGLIYVSFVGYALIRLTCSSFSFGVRSATTEMLVYPWQTIAIIGVIILFVTMVTFAVTRIAISLGRGREMIGIDKLIG
jgi:C4-dicarboxylate transporter DctQ subunit